MSVEKSKIHYLIVIKPIATPGQTILPDLSLKIETNVSTDVQHPATFL
jgi:hypothetical protein